jgi:hypothetical protein
MRSGNSIFLLLVASMSSAFKVPADQPDGLWTAKQIEPKLQNGSISAASSAQWTEPVLLVPHNKNTKSTEHVSPQQVDKRGVELPDSWAGCTGSGLDWEHFESARGEFLGQCDGGSWTGWKGIIYYKFGSAVAYVCSYDRTQPCGTEEYDEANRLIDEKCDNGKTGWVWIGGWKKLYGRDLVEHYLCGNR